MDQPQTKVTLRAWQVNACIGEILVPLAFSWKHAKYGNTRSISYSYYFKIILYCAE